MADLAELVPGLQVGMGGPALQVYIRGVGNPGSTAATNPAVAVNRDGVYVARSQAAKKHQEFVIGPGELGIVGQSIINAGDATIKGASLSMAYALTAVDRVRTPAMTILPIGSQRSLPRRTWLAAPRPPG